MILVTLDASPESEKALDTAVDLATRLGEELKILLVVDGALRHHFAKLAEASGAEEPDAIEAYLAESAGRSADSGLVVHTEHRFGVDAGTEIIDATNSPDVSLVVMATHGRSGISRLLVGSVTEQVLRGSPVPVVVVPVRGQSPA